jgi:UDP-2,3-diacylglucosamine hydrolase
MSETFFIADLHLAPNRPTPLTVFSDFLATRARSAKALYILGDLFEVWLGDDQNDSTSEQVLTALHHLTAAGVPVFVMHGNRDFLLGTRFVAVTGCQLLDEEHLIDLYGTPTLLMHGDSLCTLDVEYQAFRQQVRDINWQQQFLAQPLEKRRILAQQARANSQTKTQNMAEYIMDVTPEAVISALEKHQVSHLIHGHTHRPAVHQLTVNGQTAYRRVVGDWRDDTAIILSCSPEGCQLIDLLA